MQRREITRVCLVTLFVWGCLNLFGQASAKVCDGVRNCSKMRGAVMKYRFNGFASQDGNYNLTNQATVKLKAPILLKPKLAIIGGWSFEHFETRYQVIEKDENSFGIASSNQSQLGVLPSRFYRNDFSLAAKVNLENNAYVAFGLRGGFQGTSDISFGWDLDDMRWGVGGLWGKVLNENTEYGLGFAASYSTYTFSLLPIFMLNKTFSDHWGLEMKLPMEAKVRYNIDPQSMLFLGFKNSTYDFYMVEKDQNGIDGIARLKRLYTDLVLTYERQITGWVWGFVSTGYEWNHSSNFLSWNPGNADFSTFDKPFVEIGVYISPVL